MQNMLFQTLQNAKLRYAQLFLHRLRNNVFQKPKKLTELQKEMIEKAREYDSIRTV
jgi:hypothetical protein